MRFPFDKFGGAAWIAASVQLVLVLAASGEAVEVQIAPVIVVQNGQFMTVDFSENEDLFNPEVVIENINNEGSWSVRARVYPFHFSNQVIGASEVGEEVRRYEAGDLISQQAPTINPQSVKPLWDDRGGAEWTREASTGIVGLLLEGGLGFYSAWIEVTVDPRNNGMPAVSRYGYETNPNRDLQIPEVVLPPLKINSFEIQENSIRMTVPIQFGRSVGVEYSPDLDEGSWSELGNFFIQDGAMVFIDPDAVRRMRHRGFYRAFLRPLPD